MTNQAGGAAAEGQRGAASPRGFGGRSPPAVGAEGGAGRAWGFLSPPFGGQLSWLLRRSRRTIFRSKV
jgi:hypothetical protein